MLCGCASTSAAYTNLRLRHVADGCQRGLHTLALRNNRLHTLYYYYQYLLLQAQPSTAPSSSLYTKTEFCSHCCLLRAMQQPWRGGAQ
jgi:hypothetical protein